MQTVIERLNGEAEAHRRLDKLPSKLALAPSFRRKPESMLTQISRSMDPGLRRDDGVQAAIS
ncbi:hypothetical protein FHW83_005121 [Duganella sp. SG902]|uniref:hypothetical protein n=1 Tax=Duganella sp. SG902 TaxID=2587016 RepID=UPI00159D88C1|nr:hypothetical protein [Duganella sp. SG902]NVM79284.1 hypothetical protein [Duganella sp. SG902]